MDDQRVGFLRGVASDATARGDVNLASEIYEYLERLGIGRFDRPMLDDTPVMKERVVSHKLPVKRGKQR